LPFALIAIGIAEFSRVRSWIYYVLAGIAIALGGFWTEYLNEVPGQPSLFNYYALGAFIAVGVLGGLAYWLVAGRRAGGKRGARPPPAHPRPTAGRTARR